MKKRFLALVGWMVLVGSLLGACNTKPKNHLLPPAPPPPRMPVPTTNFYEPARPAAPGTAQAGEQAANH